MVRDNWHHHLFFLEESAPPPGHTLYFHSASNEEAGVINMQEFKQTALAAYEQAIELAPYEAILHYHKGQLLEQLGRPTEAVVAYQEAHRLGYQ